MLVSLFTENINDLFHPNFYQQISDDVTQPPEQILQYECIVICISLLIFWHWHITLACSHVFSASSRQLMVFTSLHAHTVRGTKGSQTKGTFLRTEMLVNLSGVSRLAIPGFLGHLRWTRPYDMCLVKVAKQNSASGSHSGELQYPVPVHKPSCSTAQCLNIQFYLVMEPILPLRCTYYYLVFPAQKLSMYTL